MGALSVTGLEASPLQIFPLMQLSYLKQQHYYSGYFSMLWDSTHPMLALL
jgi:hypothetical protein